MLLPDDLRLSFSGADLRSLPFFHAVLNGSTAVLLMVGFVWIKNKKDCLTPYCYDECIYLIGSIFGVLCDFKVIQCTNAYGGEGWLRPTYFFILVSHIILSIPVLPLALLAIYRGVTGEFQKHVKIVKMDISYLDVCGYYWSTCLYFMIPYYV